MKWSFRLARIAGIDLKVHFSFFLILIIGAMQFAKGGIPGMLFGAGMMLLLFVCVTLHEFGHSIVARRFGVPVRQIILLPIGGVAMLEKNPSKPLHELLIAIAGPLVNVVIAAVLLAVVGMHVARTGMGTEALLKVANGGEPSVLMGLLWLLNVNILLVAFNMIPAFPLDGGRVLRAILWFRMGFPRATQAAANVGQICAIALGVWGLMGGNILLALVAIFIFMGAGAENAAAAARTVLETWRVGDAYNKHALTLSIDDRISRVVDYLLTSHQPDFAVIQGRQLLGIVTREQVLQWLATNQYDVFVTEILNANVTRVDAQMTLEQVREKMQQAQTRIVAVYDGEQYLGLVSAEDIGEALIVLSFLQRQAAGPSRMTTAVLTDLAQLQGRTAGR